MNKTNNYIKKAAKYYFNIHKGIYVNVEDKGDHFHIWYDQRFDDPDRQRETVHVCMKVDMLPRTTELYENGVRITS